MSQIVWISHRGYCAEAVENTQAAFDASIAAGFTHLETDLRCSRDGFIVLHHDSKLTRTFGFEEVIESSEGDHLLKLGLLGFEDFMERYAAYSWIFDVKPESAQPSLLALKVWAQKRQAEEFLGNHARLLLWNRKDAALARKLFPGIGQLAREIECYQAGVSVLAKVPFLGGMKAGKTYSLPRFFAGRDLFTKEIADAYHRRGARLIAYLPKTDADAAAAVAAGFDEILTNQLPLSESRSNAI